MSKKSAVYRNLKRVNLEVKHRNVRNKYREIIKNPESTMEEKMEAQFKMQLLPKNSAKERIRTRCQVTGRARGVYSKFGLGRNELRKLASSGEVPGLKKSSW